MVGIEIISPYGDYISLAMITSVLLGLIQKFIWYPVQSTLFSNKAETSVVLSSSFFHKSFGYTI